ncbi:MAG: 7-carboxy-7-deazaguanine synthase QueE [Proteobacteria bacterium]|nr:7-carboxy-7-deazaguanine synthase QueE [Pseudomonadota bacterium]NBP13738.1 7-carboxy-7-deazaguanine synthase QueE [bacterium]
MSKLKVSELFYSVQGEGRYMGVPSVFLRVFGCNFTCDGFGMPRGERSNERNIVAQNITNIKQYRDLPLVHTGCDSYASWDPRFKDFSPMLETDAIADAIMDMLPHKRWMREHLVITGGEPLLGWQRAYPDLLNHPKMDELREITFETNGTQELTNDFKAYLQEWRWKHEGLIDRQITFSVSAKLPASGEKWEEAIKPDVVCGYESVGWTCLKLVVATEQDIEDALRAIEEYRSEGFEGEVYLMPVGGVESVYSLNNKNVALACMKYGLRYSDRLQVPLFKNEWGT